MYKRHTSIPFFSVRIKRLFWAITNEKYETQTPAYNNNFSHYSADLCPNRQAGERGGKRHDRDNHTRRYYRAIDR